MDSFTAVWILIHAILATASAAITSLSPDQLAQLPYNSKKPLKNLDTNPVILNPDEIVQYIGDDVRLSKRDAGLNSISVVDLVESAMTFEPSKKVIRAAKKANERDIVLEVVKQMIQKEKARRKYDLVNPPNSKYTKRQQLLWDRLRIKAAEELILHQSPVRQRKTTTERIFNNLKMDLEEFAEAEATLAPEPFSDMKKKFEKEYYMKQSEIGRLYISTLKPVIV